MALGPFEMSVTVYWTTVRKSQTTWNFSSTPVRTPNLAAIQYALDL